MKKPSKIEKQTKTLEKKLEQLNQLGSEELRKRWQALFGSNPPPRLRSSLMVQAIARRLQEKALGDLKPATQRLLERVAGDASAGREVSATAKKIQPRADTVLVREWHGTKHQVSVLRTVSSIAPNGMVRCHSSHGPSPAPSGQVRWFFGLKSRTEHSRGAA
jgi:Protein of unknown function (DUF2924)